MELVRLIAGATKTRVGNDDDFADRLSSRYTVVLLVTFAALVCMNQYVRNPITCWAPVHFSGAHTRFTTNYCWIKNTYYLPWEQEVPVTVDEKRQMVSYYQWIPFILLIQAVMFYIPTLIWHGLNGKAGIDADNILAVAATLSRADTAETHDHKLRLLVKHIDRFLGTRQEREVHGCGVFCVLRVLSCATCGRRLGSYLLVLFIVSKLLYILNVIGQLFLLNVILNTKYSTFGVNMISDLAGQRDWTEDSYVAFPRVTFCDFRIRGQDLANTQSYTVQCVLPVNMYNEKIYTFLWFWMVFVALISCISLVLWILRAVIPSDRRKFLMNHLRLGDCLQGGDYYNGELVRKFNVNYLKQDGALTLRLIAHNTDNITTTEIICALWDNWKKNNLGGSPGEIYRQLSPDNLPSELSEKRKLAENI